MKAPFVDLQAQLAEVQAEVRSAIDRVLASCAFASGPEVEEFEQRFANYCGTEHCVGVGSGTAALEIALRARGISTGDEVILPANTFVAAAEAIALVGAVPVFVDVREETANIDPSRIAAALTPRTRAVIPTHLYGQPAEMAETMRLAGLHNLFVLEDASQAHGATLGGARAGALAHAAAFSFYPSKNLGAFGEAGCLTTNDAELAQRARMLRDHGSAGKYRHDLVGRNDRMDGLQGAVLAVMLDHLDRWNQQRRSLAQQYRSALAAHRAVRLFSEIGDCLPVYHLLVVRIGRRDQVRQALQQCGVMTGIHYPVPLHLQPAFQRLGRAAGECPVAERLAREIISLPMYPQLKPAQVCYVADRLLELVAHP